jgi:hypothetical protein
MIGFFSSVSLDALTSRDVQAGHLSGCPPLELVHEGGLADTRLPSDKEYLPLVPQHHVKAILQLSDRKVSSHQLSFCRFDWDGVRSGTFADRCDEAVSTAGERLDESRMLRIVSERASDVSDMTAQYRRLDESLGPQGLDQFGMCNQSVSVLHQILQNAERLGCQ